MICVELIYDSDCPNAEAARVELERALAEVGPPPRWREWDRADPEAPSYVKGYGSPTILVDGRDVAGIAPSDGVSCCRLYTDAAGGFRGTPTAAMITAVLEKAGASKIPASAGWKSSLAAVPGILASLLPLGACPACWPAYAGLLGALGLGFLLKGSFLLPVVFVFLLIALAGLAHKARTRRGYGPFVLGLAGAGLIVFGKFVWGTPWIVYGGVAVLSAASIWNAWPLKKCGLSHPRGGRGAGRGRSRTATVAASGIPVPGGCSSRKDKPET